jgi:plastocyanin
MILPLRCAVGVAALLLLAAFPAPQAPGVREIWMSSRFVPGETTARAGDTLRFINQTGGPHNIQFFVDSIPEAARVLLEGAMPGEKIGPLSSPVLLNENDRYEIAVPALPPGRYPFVCLPHFASRMLGALLVTP